jgi:hypothetical protein
MKPFRGRTQLGGLLRLRKVSSFHIEIVRITHVLSAHCTRSCSLGLLYRHRCILLARRRDPSYRNSS